MKKKESEVFSSSAFLFGREVLSLRSRKESTALSR